MVDHCNNCPCAITYVRSKSWERRPRHHERSEAGNMVAHKTCDAHGCDNPEPQKQKIEAKAR